VNLDDGHSNIDGPVWSFTTGSAAPTVAVTQPTGGITYFTGSYLSIEWTADDDVAVTSVDILLSRNGVGGTYETLATGLSNDGVWSWTVTGPECSDAFIKVVVHDADDNTASDVSDAAFAIITPTAVGGGVPAAFGLGLLSENPFQEGGTFEVALKHSARVQLTVYDVAGRRVAVLKDETLPAGRHAVRWNGDTSRGHVASGVYFVRMEAAGLRFTKRVVLVR